MWPVTVNYDLGIIYRDYRYTEQITTFLTISLRPVSLLHSCIKILYVSPLLPGNRLWLSRGIRNGSTRIKLLCTKWYDGGRILGIASFEHVHNIIAVVFNRQRDSYRGNRRKTKKFPIPENSSAVRQNRVTASCPHCTNNITPEPFRYVNVFGIFMAFTTRITTIIFNRFKCILCGIETLTTVIRVLGGIRYKRMF